MNKVNLKQKLRLIHTHWDPRIVGELNGQHVRLVKFQGEFVWHKHEAVRAALPRSSPAGIPHQRPCRRGGGGEEYLGSH